jgi:hypothetical protein
MARSSATLGPGGIEIVDREVVGKTEVVGDEVRIDVGSRARIVGETLAVILGTVGGGGRTPTGTVGAVGLTLTTCGATVVRGVIEVVATVVATVATTEVGTVFNTLVSVDGTRPECVQYQTATPANKRRATTNAPPTLKSNETCAGAARPGESIVRSERVDGL